MAAKRVPRQFTDHAVILMKVVTIVRQNQVGNKFLLETFKLTFDPRLKRREKAVAIVPDHDLLLLGGCKEEIGRPQRLSFPDGGRTEHFPINLKLLILLQEAQERASASNFNIIAMRTQAQNSTNGLLT